MDANLNYYLAFSHAPGIGITRFDQLIKVFGNIEAAYNAPRKDIGRVIGTEIALAFEQFKRDFDPAAKHKEYEEQGVGIITRDDSFYPPQFRVLPDSPICIYIKGELKLYDFTQDKFFAIVGTRTPTSYGRQVAYKFARELAEAGFVIVSGMAMGIDTAAHQGALAAGGRTIAVLGNGVDIVYPAINQKLYEEIIDTGGLIISEFPLGHEARPGQFIARNRLISGLSQGVMVAEGAQDSGSLVTARLAGEQGKDVFAPPSPITSSQSKAPHILLKQGAKLVTEVTDILGEYNMAHLGREEGRAVVAALSPHEKSIYELLQREPCVVDDISQSAKLAVDETLSILSLLELKGVIERNFEGKFQLKI